MCFYCPASLIIEGDGVSIRVMRITETEVAPADVTDDPWVLAEFKAAERFLVALQATVYIENRPVATESLHGIVESDAQGEVSCAFEHEWAVECLVGRVRATASAKVHLRQGFWVI